MVDLNFTHTEAQTTEEWDPLTADRVCVVCVCVRETIEFTNI